MKNIYIYIYINLLGGWISRFLSPDGPRIYFFFLVKIGRERGRIKRAPELTRYSVGCGERTSRGGGKGAG